MHIGIAGLQRGMSHPEPLLSIVELADRLGYDSVWFNEQHFAVGVSGAPSALLLAAAALARTSRIRVRLSVVVLPAYHPVLLAEMLAQLDELGGGRLDVGIGRGSSPGLNRAVPDDRREAFDEGYRILLAAWRSPTVSAEGRHWTFQDVPVAYRPGRPLPLFIAGTSRESMALAVQDGLCLLLSLEPPEGRQIELLDDVRRELGVTGPRQISLSRYVCLAPTVEEAEIRTRALWERIQAQRRSLASERGQTPSDRSFEAFCREQVIAGDPDACLETVRSLERDHGVDHLRCVFNGNGALDAAETTEQMCFFAETVLQNRAKRGT